MAEFGLLGLEELAARRRIEIQVADIDRCALRAGGGNRGDAGRCARYFPGMGRVGGARGQRELRYRRNRCQRLAAKTQGHDAFEIGQRGDLGGRMARQRQRHLLRRYAASVVDDRNALDAALLQSHGNLCCAGIKRVFQQLLDDRGGPLDHLARRNLGNQLVGQGLDGARAGAGRICGGSIHAADYSVWPCAFAGNKAAAAFVCWHGLLVYYSAARRQGRPRAALPGKPTPTHSGIQ